MNILKILTPKRLIGNLGEREAAKLLRRKGYKILKQNYTACGAEIDIIARGKGITLFVEVKTRRTDSTLYSDFGTPASAVTRSKQQKTVEAARKYLATTKYAKLQPRFDVIEVYVDKNESNVININHIINAFGA